MREESIAKQRSPIDQRIFLEIVSIAQTSNNPDSVEKLLYNITAIARYLGLRLGSRSSESFYSKRFRIQGCTQ